MLRILRVDRGRDVILELRGRLVEPWLGLLTQEYDDLLREGRGVELDLSRVTLVSARGLDVLRKLLRLGASVTGSPLIEGMLEDGGPDGTPGTPEV